MPVSPAVEDIKDLIETANRLSEKMTEDAKEAATEGKESMASWKDLISSFDDGLSGQLKALEKTKADKRSAKIDELWKSTEKYTKLVKDMPESSIKSPVTQALMPLLVRIQDAISALQADPEDADGKLVKAVVEEAKVWSANKKKLDGIIQRDIVEGIKVSAADALEVEKNVKALSTAFASKVVDVFKKLDEVSGEQKKLLAAKLQKVHAALEAKFKTFSNSSAAKFLDQQCEVMEVKLKVIGSDIETALK